MDGNGEENENGESPNKRARLGKELRFLKRPSDPDSIGLPTVQLSAMWSVSYELLNRLFRENIETVARIKEWHDFCLATKILKIVLNSEYLGKKATLQCRLLSRSYNQVILDYLQQHPSHQALNSSSNIGLRYYSIPDPWQAKLTKDWFTHNNPLQSWEKIRLSYPPHKNPFISRAIFIRDKLIGPQYHHWMSFMSDYLRYYGSHVWHFSYEFGAHASEFRTLSSYNFLRDCLSCMPNLRTLQLEYRPHPTTISEKEHENTINLSVPPFAHQTLMHLTFLKVVNLPYPLFNEVVLKILRHKLLKLQISSDISFLDCVVVDAAEYNLELWPNLTEASIKIQESGFLMLESMENLWPLRKLHLHLDLGSTIMEWDRIFKFLGDKFCSTLTHLGLVLPDGCESSRSGRHSLMEESLNFRLNLPELKELRIEVSNITSLDFLLPMKDSLEMLFLHFNLIDYSSLDDEAMTSLGSRQLIKLDPRTVFRRKNGDTGQNSKTTQGPSCSSEDPSPDYRDSFDEDCDDDHPLKSNIWELFPKLERLTVQFSSCFEMAQSQRIYLGGSPEPIKKVYVRKDTKYYNSALVFRLVVRAICLPAH